MKEIVSVPLPPNEPHFLQAVALEKTELLKIKGGCGADKGDKRRRRTGG